MKKPVVTLLVVVLPLAVIVGLWLALGGAGRDARGPTASPMSAEPAAEAAETAEKARPDAPDVALTPADQPSALTGGEANPDARRALASEASGRHIRGQILAPAGSPPDESLRVLALASSKHPYELYGTSGLLGGLAHGEREPVLGTASVAADGRFELVLATLDDVWLALDGRFLSSPRTFLVPAAESTCTLPAELGACLRGRVRPRSSASGAPLAGLELRLDVDDEDFALDSSRTTVPFERAARTDEEGRFELRAVPPGRALALVLRRSEAFARARAGGLELEAGRVREVELELLGGATLSGIVRDEQGKPVTGAEVSAGESGLFGFAGNALAETKSDALGRFRLERIAPGKCLLRAAKDGHLDNGTIKLDLRDGETQEGLELVLGLGASIAGNVRFAEGGAAGGAEVRVDFDPDAMVGMGAFNAARGARGTTTSDALGNFEVTGLGKGPFVVRASRKRNLASEAKGDDGAETWEGKVASVKPGTRDVVLTLNPPSLLAGRVRNLAGQPVESFQLSARLESGPVLMPSQRRTESYRDPEGAFVLRGLETGKWSLQAQADGYGPMTPIEVQVPRAEETPLELVLTPAATITGKVLDPLGQPCAGARVALDVPPLQRAQLMRLAASELETQSAEDGTFRLEGLASGLNTIAADHEQFAPSESVSVETTPESPASGVVLRLRQGAVVTGEVYRADGSEAAAAKVMAQSQGMFRMKSTSADGAGHFRFEHLVPGSWTITAILEGGEIDTEGSEAEVGASFLENMRFTMVQLEDGAEQHVVLGAPPKNPVAVSGSVRHGTRSVETGGLVSFLPEGSKGFESLKIASLDGEGRFRAELPAPGDYVVTVQLMGSGGPFQQNNIEFREAIPEVPEHHLDLLLPLGSVRGRVRGPDGKPLSGARVTLTTDGGIRIGSMLGGHYSETMSDANGLYAFEYLHAGRYAVAAGGALFGGAFGNTGQLAGRLVRAGLEVAEGRALEGIDFELEEPGDLEGRVTDRNGTAVSEASIFVRDASGHLLDRFSMIASGSDGRFTYGGLSPGEYLVSARGKGLASSESAPVHVGAGEKAAVEVVLDAGTKLEVEVVDRDGEPLRASLSVLDARGREMVGMLGMSEIAAGFAAGFDGKRQTVGPLPPGAYTVVAVTAEGEKASRPVNLDGQPLRKLTLRIR